MQTKASQAAQSASHELHAWPSDGLEQVESCPVCGSTERQRLYTGLTDRVFRCAPGRWDLYQCRDCRSAYLNPRPTPATIHQAYQSYYTHKGHPAVEHLSPLRRWRRALGNGYRNWKYGTKYRPASRFGILAPVLTPRFPAKVAQSMYFLPRPEPGRRLLDVGCGNGAFLRRAASAGWQVAGVDPDPKAVGIARQAGFDVRQGGIETFEGAEAIFDVITMSHIIEHVHDPTRLLQYAHALLKPNGVAYVETPNIDAFGHQRFREHWRGLEIPRHLVLFNWDSLIQLLHNSGFYSIRRFARPTPYSVMAGQSRAIERNLDPMVYGQSTLIDKFKTIRWDIPGLLDSRKVEFLTLHAYKL